MIRQSTVFFDEIFDENKYSTHDGIKYLILNNKKKYEKNFEKTIKLKKNEEFIIKLSRKYDLFSDFIFEYDKGDVINFGEIKELPSDLNRVIKTYLIPKCNVDIFINNGSHNIQLAENINNNKNNIIKKINLNMKDDGQSFFSYISNHLPIISIRFCNIYLKFISNQYTNLNIKLKGTLLNDELRKEMATGPYKYNGKNNLVIVGGMIGNRS